MKSSLAILAILLASAAADVSHLSGHYLPPSYHKEIQPQQQQQHFHHPDGIQMTQPSFPMTSSNGRVETTIEKHELVELPTQIEIVKEGQPIYGVHQQTMDMLKNSEQLPELRSQFLPPAPEIENLQPPEVPYEMPMRTYLPPVEPDTPTTTDMPPTTTTNLPPTTTYSPEETTTEQQMTTEENTNSFTTTTTETPSLEQQSLDTTTLSPETITMPENRYLPPSATHSMPQNHYLPLLGMMLPPPEPTPQLTYQQYQEQLMREQHMQQMYREQEMQEMLHAIAEMEQQNMIALEPQQQQQQHQQPVAPVEPAHILRDDGYHYKTANNNLRRYRYRH